MKKFLSFIVLFFMGMLLFAQAPQKFTYQAVVRDAGNGLVSSQTVGVRITILQGGADGTIVYQETHTATTNINGLMTLEIGGGTVVNGDFATIDWATGPYFLKTETDPTGGTNYTIEGTQQLLSVPYALYAGHAANSFSGSYNDLTDQPDIPTVPTNVSAFTNDAGYITMDSIPEIPTVPTNVSAFVNDAGYVTESTLTTENYITQNDLITNNYVTEADIPTNVSAFTNDAGYITMDSIPEIPTVPTNVSAFVNDAGYVTQSTLTTENYITQNDLITNNYVTEADIPTNVSAFTNDAGYITMDSIPAIPTVPTNVSAFVNDAGYVTQSTLTTENYITQNDLITNNYVTEADIPTNVSAFTNDAGYITMDSVPAIPTNVSAFVNDAGYVTESTLTTENYITQNDLITNNYVTEADIPTNVSAFNNDAGYITMDSIPAIPIVPTNVSAFTNDAGYITESTLANNSYITQNDLITNNYVTEADIPTNVSAFTNDAGYITMDSVPTIPTNVSVFTNDAGYITNAAIPTNISVFTNDAGYLTSATVQEAANIPTNVSAFTNDANYITLAQVPAQVNADWNATSGAAQIMNKPTIPTVPTNVSAFTNDANYITNAALPTNVSAFANDANYITAADVPAIPTNVSTFTNDANYITLAQVPVQVNADWNATSGAAQIMNKPTIPTVPTNVSAFTNDANYITNAAIPTNVSTFTNDANYITAADVPAIPTNVSTFTNDANYITLAQVPAQVNADWNATSGAAQIMNKPTIPTVPTNVSAFTNDANYITAADVPAIPANVSTFTNDANYITLAQVPSQVNADWNATSGAAQIMNKPAIPTVPTNVSAFTNDAGYITSYTEQQILSISNDTIYLTGGSFAKLPAGFSGSYNDLTDVPENVSTFSNDAGYLTRDSLESYNMTPDDIQALLDRLEELEMQLSLPTISTSPVTNVEMITAMSGGIIASSNTPVWNRGICWNNTGDPTIEDPHTTNGSGIGSFTSSLTNLSPNTTYYVRSYATNSAGVGYGETISFTTKNCPSTLTDRDGNSYNTVRLANQCWMRENLRTTKYADGTSISQGSSGSTSVAYWYYPNNSSSNKTTYGLLYNWKAVMRNSSSSSANPSGVQGICPTGWHVPSQSEWQQLTNYVKSQSQYICGGDNTQIAKALASTTGWSSSTGTCTVGNTPSNNNSTGFTAVPSGIFNGYNNTYQYFGGDFFSWSSTQKNSSESYRVILWNDNATVGLSYSDNKYCGESVRCVKD